VVVGQHGQRGIEAVVGQGKRLGSCMYAWRGFRRSLGEHHGRRFYRDHVQVGGFISTRAGTNVYDRARVRECVPDGSGYAGSGPRVAV